LAGEDKPTVAFALSIAGAALQTIAAIAVGLLLVFFGGAFPWWGWRPIDPSLGWSQWSIIVIIWVALTAVVLVLSFLGAAWINSADPLRVRSGSIVVLVAALIALPTGWGIILGSLLMIAAAIIGLTWKPRLERKKAAPVQPASPWEF